MQYKTLYETPEKSGVVVPKQLQADMETMQRVLKTVEEAFEKRPDGFELAPDYFRCDDLHIRKMINYVLRLQDKKYELKCDAEQNGSAAAVSGSQSATDNEATA